MSLAGVGGPSNWPFLAWACLCFISFLFFFLPAWKQDHLLNKHSLLLAFCLSFLLMPKLLKESFNTFSFHCLSTPPAIKCLRKAGGWWNDKHVQIIQKQWKVRRRCSGLPMCNRKPYLYDKRSTWYISHYRAWCMISNATLEFTFSFGFTPFSIRSLCTCHK